MGLRSYMLLNSGLNDLNSLPLFKTHRNLAGSGDDFQNEMTGGGGGGVGVPTVPQHW